MMNIEELNNVVTAIDVTEGALAETLKNQLGNLEHAGDFILEIAMRSIDSDKNWNEELAVPFQLLTFNNGAFAFVRRQNMARLVDVVPQPNYYEGSMTQLAFDLANNMAACSMLSFIGSSIAGENYHLLREALPESDETVEIFKYLD